MKPACQLSPAFSKLTGPLIPLSFPVHLLHKWLPTTYSLSLLCNNWGSRVNTKSYSVYNSLVTQNKSTVEYQVVTVQ